MTDLVADPTTFDFFHPRVLDAVEREATVLHADTVLYLAQLLTERTRQDAVPTISTLAELRGRALQAPPGEAAASWRALGDHTLYLLGCFAPSLDRSRRLVGPDYYESMGRSAYEQCDRVLARWFAGAFGPVFAELAERFQVAMRILRHAGTRERPKAHVLDPAPLGMTWAATVPGDG